MSSFITDTQQQHITSGKRYLFDLGANVLQTIEKNLSVVDKCSISREEISASEKLQKDIRDNTACLLLGETCCDVLARLASILDVSAQVPELKKYAGN